MFGFGSKTTVVTQRAQLAAALRDSDKVVVEGDADLLNYALGFVDREAAGRADLLFETRVAGAAPLRPAPRLSTIERDPDAAGDGEREPVHPDAKSRPAFPSPAEPPLDDRPEPCAPPPPELGTGSYLSARRRAYGLPSLLIGTSIIVAALLAVYGTAIRPVIQRQDAVAGPPPEPSPAVHGSPSPDASDIAAIVQSVVWPAVAIVALVVMYLLARQAISADRNVEVSWKITEKVGGRLVITKVKTAAPRKKAA